MPSTQFFRKGCQAIATIDIVISVLSFISIFFLICLTITYGDTLEKGVHQAKDGYPELAALFALGRSPFVMIMLIFMSICVIYFFLARYLLHAASDRSYPKIRRWCTISGIIIIIRAAFFITAIFFTVETTFVSSLGAIGFLYQVLCLWFVRIYQDKLRADNETKLKFIEDLSNIEIHVSHLNQTHLFPLNELQKH